MVLMYWFFIKTATTETYKSGQHLHPPSALPIFTRRTRTGYALMQSRKLIVTGNRSEQDQNYGILMNYITYSTITGNYVSDVQRGDTGDRKSTRLNSSH